MPEPANDQQALLSAYLSTPPAPAREDFQEDPRLISYTTLRAAVGWIGTLLPFVLALGKLLLDGPELEGSVSGYYYSSMRDVFVGSLCAIAVFLFTYKGYDRRDDIAGNVAGLSALGVALFPTTPGPDPTARERLVGTAHLVSAAVFFVTLAIFCLWLFVQSDQSNPTPQKLRRNWVYRFCGSLILACLALIAGIGLLDAEAPLRRLAPVFWLEAIAIVAFGVSWLTKAEVILEDKG